MIYVDSCAIIKLVVPEPETVALSAFLDATDEPLATSKLSTVEVRQQLIRTGADGHTYAIAHAALGGPVTVALAPAIAVASQLPGQHLRSLDALHLATAQSPA